MDCKIAKKIDLEIFLKNQGFLPIKTKGETLWYLSPLREEHTPSFKVDTNKNIWYDFGEGYGGTIIDLLMRLNNCSVKDVLSMLSLNTFSFHQQPQQIKDDPKYSIIRIKELSNQKLLDYLTKRKINLDFAKKYCCEVHYSFTNGKPFYGIGFINNSNGYEVRNQYYKGCLGKKAITTICNNFQIVSLFESWSDFLSYLTLKKKVPNENFIILNSTSMVKKTVGFLDHYSEIKIFFDNDAAGDIATDFLMKQTKHKAKDQRVYYKNHNDLNEYLLAQS